MGEDLHNCNLEFRNLLEKAKTKTSISKEMESLLYFFFLSGFNLNSGMTQVIS